MRRNVGRSLHFVMLGGLRYNRLDLLELIGGKMMIPLEQLRESSFYQFILEEGVEKERHKQLEITANILRHLIAKRFAGLQLGDDLDAISDLDGLQSLVIELDDIHDPDTLRRRLAELAAMTQSSSRS